MNHWAPDYFDPHYDNNEEGNALRPRNCRYCGKRGLHWEELTPGEWKLVDTKTNEIHKCAVPPPDFDAL